MCSTVFIPPGGYKEVFFSMKWGALLEGGWWSTMLVTDVVQLGTRFCRLRLCIEEKKGRGKIFFATKEIFSQLCLGGCDGAGLLSWAHEVKILDLGDQFKLVRLVGSGSALARAGLEASFCGNAVYHHWKARRECKNSDRFPLLFVKLVENVSFIAWRIFEFTRPSFPSPIFSVFLNAALVTSLFCSVIGICLEPSKEN